MAIVKSQIDITAKDSTAAAFASVNTGLSGLASSALKVSGALSALGATAVIGSFAAFTKQTIDAQDNLSKLSQKTGIAVESLAGLEFAAEQSGVELDKVAKATRAFSLLVAESADKSSGAAKKLEQLGLSYKDLKDLSPEKQILALSDALSKFSKQDQAVALTSVLGNKMADLIPLLSGGSKELGALIEQGKKFNPVTAQSAKQAELFNDQLNVLSKSVSAIGRGLVQEMVPGLSAVADRMAKVTQESGFLKGALAGVKELFIQSFGNPKILGDVGQIRREIFKTQEVIANLSVKKDSVFFDSNALQHEKDKLAQLEIDLQKAIVTSRGVVEAQTANTESTKKFAIALEETAPKLGKQVSAQDALQKAQSKSLSIESEYIKLLNIERQARENLLKPYQQEAASAEDRLSRMREEAVALDLSQRKQISLEQAIEETTIARLEEKRVITKDAGAVTAIDREIAARKQIVSVIKNSEDRTKQLGRITASTTDEVSQLWMQAGRNIQSALANGIFNFFDDGLKGMVNNVVSTVGRIASEFAALKLAQGIGLSSIFGVAGGIGGTGVAASNALSVASLGSSASNLFKGGFGIPSFAGRGLSSLGGSIGAFGGGLAGSSAGVFSSAGGAGTAFIGGAGTAIGGSGLGGAAGLGAGVAAAAGPLAVAAIADVVFRMLAGNKSTGSKVIDSIPIIGSLGALLFGHGPLKFRQQSIQGTASSEGFDGDISNVFRAKGGLFVGNKHKTQTEQFNLEQQTLFDDTLKGFYGSAHSFAKNLGLSTDLVDNFTKEIQIKSEKGKQVTEEAIADMLKGIGNSLAQNVLPMVDTFRKAGEDSFATLSRLNTEFVSLTQAAVNLGASVDYAKQTVGGLGIDTRTAYVEAAGGVETLIGLSAKFNQNFLTQAEQIAPTIKLVEDGLRDLGQSADITKDQFKSLVQNLTLAGDANALLLLQYQDQFLAVNQYKESLKQATDVTQKAAKSQSLFVADNRKELQQKRINALLDSANNTIGAISQNIDKLVNLSGLVKDATSQISPQSVEDARSGIRGNIEFDRRGNVRGIKRIDAIDQGSIATLSSMSASGFGDRLSFLRSQGKNLEVLQLLGIAVGKALDGVRESARSVASERNKIPSFDVGGIVPKTSIAMVHKGERIINPQQNEALVDLLQQLLTAAKSGANYSQSVYNLLKNMTNDGFALNTVAA